jgi:hypothetical protein
LEPEQGLVIGLTWVISCGCLLKGENDGYKTQGEGRTHGEKGW